MAGPRRSLASSSPPSVGHSTLSSVSHPRIVSKLALDGRAKNNGATLKLFLKVRVRRPLSLILSFNSLLFLLILLPRAHQYRSSRVSSSLCTSHPSHSLSDKSLKIVNSIVHPMDSNGTPYAFSSPTLLQASHSLGLQPRSSRSYVTLFPDLPADHPLDPTLTGHISVVDYQVSYVLPKEFPPHILIGERPAPSHSRVASLDRYSLFFLAAIDVVLPFQSVPPFAPYVVCHSSL
jgi:hypothetical protein